MYCVYEITLSHTPVVACSFHAHGQLWVSSTLHYFVCRFPATQQFKPMFRYQLLSVNTPTKHFQHVAEMDHAHISTDPITLVQIQFCFHLPINIAAIALNSMLHSGYHRTAYNAACQQIFYSTIWQITYHVSSIYFFFTNY